MNAGTDVLVTYCDEGALLLQCLESFFAGPEIPGRIWVHDDASLLPAEQVLQRWKQRERVRVLRSPARLGDAGARNRLLEASQAEYVHFHDADDTVSPQWAGRVRAALAERGPDVLITDVRILSQEGRVLSPSHYDLKGARTVEDWVRAAILCGRSILPCAATMRRELALGIGGYPVREGLRMASDLEFHIRLLAACGSAVFIAEPLAELRLRPQSLSREDGEQKPGIRKEFLSVFRSLSESLPGSYRCDLAEEVFRRGLRWYRAGERADARSAFELSRTLGGARMDREHAAYRFAAACLGPEGAETLRALIRRRPSGKSDAR